MDKIAQEMTLVVQAGGKSSRMGQDKALLPFLGKPLITRVIRRLRPLAAELLVTTNHPDDFRFLKLPLVEDVLPGRGALGGLLTALAASHQPLVAVVACDMPFASPALLAAERDLLTDPAIDAAIPRLEEGAEPFHSVYRRDTCLPLVQAAINSDKWRVDSWFGEANIHFLHLDEIKGYDPRGLAFLNTNTPEDLAKAIELAEEIDSC